MNRFKNRKRCEHIYCYYKWLEIWGIQLKSRWLRAVKNHCKASKIHSSGDIRPGLGRGKVRKTDERVEICRN